MARTRAPSVLVTILNCLNGAARGLDSADRQLRGNSLSLNVLN